MTAWDDAWADARATVDQLDATDLFLNTNSPNWLGLADLLPATRTGARTKALEDGVASDRAVLSGLMTPANVRTRLLPHLQNIADVANISTRDVPTMLARLRDYMVANAFTINSRNMTLPVPGTVGGGTIQRLTVDQDGFQLNGVHPEIKDATCRADARSVDEHEEVFDVEGEDRFEDFIQVTGSGLNLPLTAVSARGSQSFVANPSFDNFDGTAPTVGSPATPSTTTEITDWTLDDAAAARVLHPDDGRRYRSFPGEQNGYSVRFTGNNKLDQVLQDTVAPTFAEAQPVYVQVAVYRENLCDGTFTLRYGAASKAVVMTTLVNNAWNVVNIDIGTSSWLKTFNEANLDVELELSGRTTGELVLDDLIVTPFTAIDGTFYVAVGGQTPFLLNDTVQWTDVDGAPRARIGYWWWRAGFGWLPSSGTPTIVD